MLDDDPTVSALNELIETCKDSEEGFTMAADGPQDPRTRSLFQQYSRQHAEVVRELPAEVGRLAAARVRTADDRVRVLDKTGAR